MLSKERLSKYFAANAGKKSVTPMELTAWEVEQERSTSDYYNTGLSEAELLEADAYQEWLSEQETERKTAAFYDESGEPDLGDEQRFTIYN